MKDFVDQMVNDIVEDSRKAVRKAMNETAKQIERDFLTQAKIYLDNYYMEYDPDWYKRTDNLRENSLHPSRRYRANVVEAGIEFSSVDMKPYSRHPNAKSWEPRTFATLEDYVLFNAMYGFHGNEDIHSGTKIDDEMAQYLQWYGDNMLDKILDKNMAKFFD